MNNPLTNAPRGVLLIDTAHGMNSHDVVAIRSEEHTSELKSPNTISYADFCLKKKRREKKKKQKC